MDTIFLYLGACRVLILPPRDGTGRDLPRWTSLHKEQDVAQQSFSPCPDRHPFLEGLRHLEQGRGVYSMETVYDEDDARQMDLCGGVYVGFFSACSSLCESFS